MKEDIFKKKILAYSLSNAIQHNGKALPNSILNHLFREGLKREQIKEVIGIINETVSKVNSFPIELQRKEFEKIKDIMKVRYEKEKHELRELPSPSKNMKFRLAPFPSGALHIGNAKTYLLNALYAEKYKGKILLVMDDTIGSKEKRIIPEAYKLIEDAFKWLDIKYEKPIIYKSSRLRLYYRYAEKLIRMGKAYVCSCSASVLRKNREKARECGCRQFPVNKQLARWKRMLEKNAREGSYTLRIKTDMQHKNPAFRDRVLFRISERPHPRTKNKYKVWPLLEFSWAIDDHLLKITHIIRGKDLMMESEMEKFIWKIFNWKIPEIMHAGLVRIKGVSGASETGNDRDARGWGGGAGSYWEGREGRDNIATISKSKAQKEVIEGKFSSWDDPRTWSIQSLKRRGFLPEAIRKFVKEIGLNENDIIVPIESLYAINRKMLDKQADRFFFVANPIKIEIKDMPRIKEVSIRIHPEKSKKRKLKIAKQIFISKQDYENFIRKELRLLNLFNIKLETKRKARFTSGENKDLQRIQWVSQNLRARIMMPNGKWLDGLAEENIKKIKIGEIIQFERVGFCRLDRINEAGVYEFWFAHR